MADIVRSDEELVAIRFSTEAGPSGASIVARASLGRDDTGEPVRVPLTELGFRDLTAGRPLRVEPVRALPDALAELVFEAAWAAHVRHAALWLQINRGAEILAALPWEHLAAKILPLCPVLRVPNFVRHDLQPRPDGPIAICAAVPAEGTAPSLIQTIAGILEDLEASSLTRRPVIIFLGNQDRAALAGRFGRLGLDISLAEPTSDTAPPDAARVRNAWLRWIAGHRAFARRGADLVHVIAPGFASTETGSLSLPTTTDGMAGRQLVEVGELARVLDLLDARVTGFTPVGSLNSRCGVRMFANALSWQRPGAVFVADDDAPPPSGRRAALATLLSGAPLATEPLPDLSLSAHPRTVLMGGERRSRLDVPGSSMRSSSILETAAGRELPPGLIEDLFDDLPDTPPARQVSRAISQLTLRREENPSLAAQTEGRARALSFLKQIVSEEARNKVALPPYPDDRLRVKIERPTHPDRPTPKQRGDD